MMINTHDMTLYADNQLFACNVKNLAKSSVKQSEHGQASKNKTNFSCNLFVFFKKTKIKMNEEKIEKIQQELKQLSQKQLELSKAHRQRIKSHEEQKTLYQHLFGQPPLQPDPELQSVNSEIEDLKEQRRDYFKILQAAASIPPPVPEKDWSKSPFYSHTLKSWNFDYPVDQMGFYVTTLTGIGIVSKALWRSYNIRKAYTAIQMGIKDDIDVYLHRSGLNEEKDVYRAMKSEIAM